MAVTWNTFLGGAFFFDALDAIDEAIQGATTTGFYMQTANAEMLSFQGQFTLDQSGNITGGTITGFKGFVGGTQVLNAYGYQMDFKAFNSARNSANVFDLIDILQPNGFTMNGSLDNDLIVGGRFDDVLNGYAGDDFMVGYSGNDIMTGGEGKDLMNGGDGIDTVSYLDRSSPVEVTLNGSEETIVKVGGVEEDHIGGFENVIGGGGNDKLTGDGFSNGLAGLGGDDKLLGNDGNDLLQGNDGRDKIDGGKGNDKIAGGLGNDVLKGGKNSDTFFFIDALDKHNNVDKIKDFKPGVDGISLYQGVFAALNVGDLKGKYFHEGHKAADHNDRIIYDDGTVYYDPDGKGGVKQVEFVKLKGAPDLSAHDFVVI